MTKDELASEVLRVYESVRMATASEDLALRGVPGAWWAEEPGLTGLAGRREPHVVHAIAAFLRQIGYVVVVDDGAEAGHREEGCAQRCDLAVRLPLKEPRWLWLEVTVVLEEEARARLEEVRADLVRMRQVSAAQWNKRLQGLLLVGFGAHGPAPSPPLKLQFVRFAQEQWLDQWPLARIATRGIEAGSPLVDTCVLGMWVRYDRQAR